MGTVDAACGRCGAPCQWHALAARLCASCVLDDTTRALTVLSSWQDAKEALLRLRANRAIPPEWHRELTLRVSSFFLLASETSDVLLACRDEAGLR